MAKFTKGPSIYPSELSEAGELILLVLGPHFKSKYPNKRTKAPVYSVKVDIEGEGEKYLNFDEQAQAQSFDKFDGQKVKILFDGTDVKITPMGGGPAMPGPAAKVLSMQDVDGIRVRMQNAMFYSESAILEQSAAVKKYLNITCSDDNFGGKASNLLRVLISHGALGAFPDDHYIWEEQEKPEPAE